MNKVASKGRGCAGKKCAPQQNEAQAKPPEPQKQAANVSKVKVKGINGMVNGAIDDKKTEQPTASHKLEEPKQSTSKLEEPETSESKGAKKKSKKRASKPEVVETTDDYNNTEFDILAIINNKYKDVPSSNDCKEVASQLEKLDIGTTEQSDTMPEEPRIENPNIEYVAYESELQMPLIMKIIQKDLSEPYSIYTYRYFIHNWPNLCFLAMCGETCVGAIVCKLDMHRKVIKRGYIAMLAVDKRYRKHGIGSTLVRRAIQEMIAGNADEVVLETEITNKPALRLYEALGFVRDKRLFRYYLNGVDALRLKLWLR